MVLTCSPGCSCSLNLKNRQSSFVLLETSGSKCVSVWDGNAAFYRISSDRVVSGRYICMMRTRDYKQEAIQRFSVGDGFVDSR